MKNRKKVGNYPAINVVFSITTSLFMIGLFSLLAITAQRLTESARNNVQMQVLLANDLSEAEIENLKNRLSSSDFVQVDRNGVPLVVYKSKADMANKMNEELGGDFLALLGGNPLRNAFVINIKRSYFDGRLPEIAGQIKDYVGVFEVSYTENLIDEINQNIRNLAIGTLIFVAIFIVTVVILINSAIKLALFSQRFLIRSMQLVGATNDFIIKPFVYKALIHGLVSAFIAATPLVIIYLAADNQLDVSAFLSPLDLLAILVFMMLCGSSIATTSAHFAVKKYLKKRLDDLY